jgi:hypothetical protein
MERGEYMEGELDMEEGGEGEGGGEKTVGQGEGAGEVYGD